MYIEAWITSYEDISKEVQDISKKIFEIWLDARYEECFGRWM